jgi:MFS family permease
MIESEPDHAANGAYRLYCHILLTLGFVVSTVDRHVAAVVAVPMKQSLGLSDTQLGLVQGFAFALCYATAAIPVAWMVDRGNRVRIVAACVGLWSAGTAISGIASNFLTLLIGRTVTAVSEAGYSPGALSLLSDIFDRKSVARATALYMLAPSVGLGMAMIGGGALLGHFERQGGFSIPGIGVLEPWQCVFVAAGVPGVLLALLLGVSIREPARRSVKAQHAASVAPRETLTATTRALAPFLIPYVLGCTLILLVMFSLAAWSATFLVRSFDITAAEAGSALGPVVLIGGILGPVVASFLVAKPTEDRLINRMTWIVVVAGIVTAISVSLLPFAPSRWAAMMVVTISILSASTVAPMVVSPIQLMVPNRLRARTQAIASFVFTVVAGGVGPTLIGITTDRLFADEAMLGSSIALVCAISSVLGVLSIFVSRRALSVLAATAFSAAPAQ